MLAIVLVLHVLRHIHLNAAQRIDQLFDPLHVDPHVAINSHPAHQLAHRLSTQRRTALTVGLVYFGNQPIDIGARISRHRQHRHPLSAWVKPQQQNSVREPLKRIDQGIVTVLIDCVVVV